MLGMCAVGSAGDAGEILVAARPFAGGDQRGGEQRAEEDAHAGPDQACSIE